MSYIDGFLAAVPDANKDAYLEHARIAADIFKEFGAERIVECWEDDVPDGKITDFRRSVQRQDGESVVFSWVQWPDKATRDAGWAKMMEDPRMADMQMPLDGKRMVYGGFAPILDV